LQNETHQNDEAGIRSNGVRGMSGGTTRFNQARMRLKPRVAQLLTSKMVRKFWSPVNLD
jgi:hypothetical protein